MQIQHVSEQKLKDDIKRTIEELLPSPEYKIFIFGSRITNKAGERSDIDVGIEGPMPIDPVKKLLIRENLEELPYLYRFDLVDFASVSEDFKKEAGKNIELLN